MAGPIAGAMVEALRQRGCCAGCRYWNQRREGDLRAPCHRFPPQIVVRTQEPKDWVQRSRGQVWEQRPEHYFPTTNHDAWCGEFDDGGQSK